MRTSRKALEAKEDYLLFGDFADARQALIDGDYVSQYELKQLVMMATGVDETTAFLLVDAIEKVTKKRILTEVNQKVNKLLVEHMSL